MSRNESLSCGHDAEIYDGPMCFHLKELSGPDCQEYYKLYTGTGLEYVLLCQECLDKPEKERLTDLFTLCEECHEETVYEFGDQVAVQGQPEIQESPKDFKIDLRLMIIPSKAGEVIDIAELSSSSILLLNDAGGIFEFDIVTKELNLIMKVSLDKESLETWCGFELKHVLYCSPCGDFAAVINDFGSVGQILSLSEKTVIKILDAGDYHPDKLHFEDSHEAIYMQHVKTYNKEGMNNFAKAFSYLIQYFMHHSDDLLGELYMQGNTSKLKHEVYTPFHICELMAQI